MNQHPFLDRIDRAQLVTLYGRVQRVMRAHCEASGPAAAIGELCLIEPGDDGPPIPAEVAAVAANRVTLVPLERNRPIHLSARVQAISEQEGLSAGDGFSGRAVDALGRPIDAAGPLTDTTRVKTIGTVPRPFDRTNAPIAIETGVRAIDGLLTLAEGQRVGIFAAAGVGKTSLVEQLAAQVKADRCVLCLVGERGREVEAMWRTLRTGNTHTRFTMVAATSDESAPLRARAVEQALALAEYWRDRGEHVFLVIDSVTRLAMALREIGLAAGEPPTVRAYTPNVFASLPRLVERCGGVRSGGAITAVMTVLSETDDVDDPIVEVMKSLLDGHIVLSRALAERGHFPAIDIARSISRQSASVMTPEHARASRSAIAMLGTYDDSRVMVESGVYRAGSNEEIDRAIAARPALMAYLRQDQGERAVFVETVRQLDLAASRGARV